MSIQRNNWLISRRHFLETSLVASIAASVRAADRRPPRILLRSSWQVINIGDIGHTPGVLALLEKHLPEAEVQLSGNVSDGVGTMLEKRFPKLVILKDAKALKPAFAECDFLLHGSGPWLVSPNTIELWTKETGKPYGVYGITLPPNSAAKREIDLLSKARFVFFRDSVSLQVAKDKGVTCPVMTDASAVHLLKLKKLKSIILNGPKMTAVWHGNLSSLPLEFLSVSQGNALPAAQAIAGARSIPTLRRFAVDGKTLTDADLTALAGMTQLESLSIGDIDLPDTRLPQLQKFAQLKSLTLVRYGKGYPDETQAKVKAVLPKAEVKFVQ